MWFLLLPLLLASEPAWQALRDTGLHQEAQGQFAHAEAAFSQAIRLARDSAAEPQHLASLYNNLGHVQISRANYLAAEPSLKRALALYHRHPNPRDLEWTFALNNLAILYEETGRLPEAEAAQRQALDARKAVLGPQHPLVANVQVTLAALLAANKQYTPARQLLESALATFQTAPGHALYQANVLVNLANLAVHQRDLPQALAHVRQACRLYEANTAPGHPSRIQSQLTLAHILLDQRDYTNAASAATEAVRLLRIAHPNGHPYLAQALTLQAEALAKTGRKSEARHARTEAEAIARTHRATNPANLTIDAKALTQTP